MPRPLRKKLAFNEESVNKLLQEIYDDSFNIKARIARLFTKWEQKVKDGGEIAALGDSIVKLIGAEAKNQDQKIMLLKYLKEVVFERKIGICESPHEDSGDVSDNERKELIRMVQEEMDKKDLLKNPK